MADISQVSANRVQAFVQSCQEAVPEICAEHHQVEGLNPHAVRELCHQFGADHITKQMLASNFPIRRVAADYAASAVSPQASKGRAKCEELKNGNNSGPTATGGVEGTALELGAAGVEGMAGMARSQTASAVQFAEADNLAWPALKLMFTDWQASVETFFVNLVTPTPAGLEFLPVPPELIHDGRPASTMAWQSGGNVFVTIPLTPTVTLPAPMPLAFPAPVLVP